MQKALRLAGIKPYSESTVNYALAEDDTTDDDEGIVIETASAGGQVSGFGNSKPRFEVTFVQISSDGNRVRYRARWGHYGGHNRQQGTVQLHPVVITFFGKWINKTENHKYHGECIPIYTEWSNQGVCFRAHPNFRSEGAWYEWASIGWETNNDGSDDHSGSNEQPSTPKRQKTGIHFERISPDQWPIEDKTILEQEREYPAMLLAFFRHPNGEDSVIIHSAKRRTRAVIDSWTSVICEPWELEYSPVIADPLPAIRTTVGPNAGAARRYKEPILRQVSVYAIERRLFVIPESRVHPVETIDVDDPTLTERVLLIRDMELYWPRFFTEETIPLTDVSEVHRSDGTNVVYL
jgi:hypothetical protein